MIIDGLDLRKAPFEDILGLKGIGPAKMRTLMKQIGRYEEYQEWKAPLNVDGIEVSRAEIGRYGNLVGTQRRLGFDPEDPKYAGITQSERSQAARQDFQRARDRGDITDMDIARVVAEMKRSKVRSAEREAKGVVKEVAGFDLDDLNEITKKIQDKYEMLQREYIAPTTAGQGRLFHVASLMANLEIIDEAYTRINARVASADQADKYTMQKLGFLSDQSKRITQEMNSILKDFRKADEIEQGPQQYVTGVLQKGEEVFDVFFRPVECPGCHTRFGIVGKFFPRETVEFPVIEFDCPVVHPGGDRCGGHVYVDIDQHLEAQKVIKFTTQEHFDPDVVARQLLEEEAMG